MTYPEKGDQEGALSAIANVTMTRPALDKNRRLSQTLPTKKAGKCPAFSAFLSKRSLTAINIIEVTEEIAVRVDQQHITLVGKGCLIGAEAPQKGIKIGIFIVSLRINRR